jgi:CRP-like cAMP-binding protein
VHPATKNLPDELWNALQQIGCTRTCEPGAILFSEQAESQGVYLVERGAITIQMSPPTQQLSQTAGAGTLLGLSEALCCDTHKFDAIAGEDCVIRFVARQEFLEFLRQNQACCMQIVRLLSDDLHALYHRFQTRPRFVHRGRKKAG